MKKRQPGQKKLPVSDLSELLKPYRSGWVALSSDESHVVAFGETLHDAREQAKHKFAPDAIFVKVIPPDQGYLPALL
jgi:hypothetical protein